jgi:hypothetical protein
MKRVGLVVAGLVALTGCGPTIIASGTTRIEVPAPVDTIGSEIRGPAIVEVRGYPHSPVVSVIGWTADDIGYGLRTWVRRDGTPATNHRLYVSTYYVAAPPSFTRAVTQTRPLELTGRSRDVYACSGGNPCSPYETFGALIPDTFLRSNRDSLAVTFYGRGGQELLVTLRRDAIDAYLGAVDSLMAVLRKDK